MSKWFQNRRQEFIYAQLKQFGQIRRKDLAREFDITLQIASDDIQKFIAHHPRFIKYDVTAKMYVLEEINDQE